MVRAMELGSKRLRQLGLAALGAIALSLSVGKTARADLEDLLSGSDVPLALQLQDFDGEWRILSVYSEYEYGLLLNAIGSIISLTPAEYYTRGETVAIADETFVIAYRVPGVPKEPPSATTSVTLSLVNLKAISSFNNVRPFELEAELERLQNRAVPNLLDALPLPGGSGNSEAPVPEPSPLPKYPSPWPDQPRLPESPSDPSAYRNLPPLPESRFSKPPRLPEYRLPGPPIYPSPPRLPEQPSPKPSSPNPQS